MKSARRSKGDRKGKLEVQPDGFQCLTCGQLIIGRELASCPSCGGTDLLPFLRPTRR